MVYEWKRIGLHSSLIFVFMLLLGCAKEAAVQPDPGMLNTVAFDWFEYEGQDEIFTAPLDDGKFQNPIVAGFFPDPSITRKGVDYYMAHSSFGYMPGVPILHSRDLVHWQLIGHAIDRSSQVDFENLDISHGIFAPTLRYHNGLFYMITTAVYGGGNFYVTAEDPAGPWSDPVWLPEVEGIDPDIFFDDDGRVYLLHNAAPEGEPLYDGHRTIWLWEYDLASKKVIPGSRKLLVNGGVNLVEKPIWIEGPHLYKINGWYYLMCAEGGTSVDHREVIFRARTLSEPFLPFKGNPILTQRNLPESRENPVSSTGHADLIQTPEGEWWAVFLATRPYAGNYYNTGRETFLLPVRWEADWPTILPAGETVPYQVNMPKGGSIIESWDALTGNVYWRDEFDKPFLGLYWNTLRKLEKDWLTLKSSKLLISGKSEALTGNGQSAYIARRQQNTNYSVKTQLELPESGSVSAGLVAFQNSRFHYYFGVRKMADNYVLFVERTSNGNTEVIQESALVARAGDALILNIAGESGDIKFNYQLGEDTVNKLLTKADGKILSTEVAGGFVGTTLGPHVRLEL